jgi:hypothetical protein
MSCHTRGSGPRSNWYSEDKFTNWTRFNPFESEINALPLRARPREVVYNGGQRVPVFVRPLNERFVRPFSAEEVGQMIERVPAEFVDGLRGIILLGGTRKQDVVCRSGLYRYGCYGGDRIYLHPYPRRLLREWLGSGPSPYHRREYGASGVDFVQRRGRCTLHWSAESLRRYYLHNVLLHEIGHHVDKRDANRRKRERFADWFAVEQARVLAR